MHTSGINREEKQIGEIKKKVEGSVDRITTVVDVAGQGPRRWLLDRCWWREEFEGRSKKISIGKGNWAGDFERNAWKHRENFETEAIPASGKFWMSTNNLPWTFPPSFLSTVRHSHRFLCPLSNSFIHLNSSPRTTFDVSSLYAIEPPIYNRTSLPLQPSGELWLRATLDKLKLSK